MRRKVWVLIVLAGLLVPLGAAMSLGPVPEQLVEGHTVLAVLQPRVPDDNASVFAAALAVLVEEREESPSFRFPGVLWFNDQYLVNPFDSDGPLRSYPKCSGTVYALPRGAGNPVEAFHNVANLSNPLGFAPQYNESYLLTDPLDRRWVVHRWLVNSTTPGSPVVPVWTVAIMNNLTAFVPKDAADACVQETRNCLGSNPPVGPTDDTCTMNGRQQREFRYNALLLIPLDLLEPDGYADHSLPNGANLSDPAEEGNSHAFNPLSPVTNSTSLAPLPSQYRELDALRFPHGGSSDECLPATLEWRCHATYDIDVFYDERPVSTPALQFNMTWFDVEGSTSPYLCEASCPGSPT